MRRRLPLSLGPLPPSAFSLSHLLLFLALCSLTHFHVPLARSRRSLTITYGLNGSIRYTAYVEGIPRAPAIYYRATGDMGSSASLKIGNYRRATSGQQASTAYIGAFNQTRLA